jgi:hypothetical protein
MPRGNTAGGPSRKRARAATDSDGDDDDDDTLSDDSEPPQTKPKVEVEVDEIDDFSIMSAASDLNHTACGLVQHGAPTS